MFCELCVNACPHNAIRFSNDFENAVFQREKLVLKLNHEGSSVVKKVRNDMDITLQQTVFYVVAILMSVFSVMTVTTKSILRSATYLLFVLFGTAAIYFILGYTFLGAVQLMVYAGGIVVLYVFSILLTNSDKSINLKICRSKMVAVLATIILGAALVLFPYLDERICAECNS